MRSLENILVSDLMKLLGGVRGRPAEGPVKARSAALFKKPTKDLEDAINHGRCAGITAPGFIEMQWVIPVWLMARWSEPSARASRPLSKMYMSRRRGWPRSPSDS